MVEFSYTEAVITPRVKLRLGGYMHRLGLEAHGIRDDLYVRLLRISNSRVDFVIIQLDLLGLYLDRVNEIRDTVRKTLGLKPEEIMVSATHTHSAPETVIPMWPNTLPYTKDEEEKLKEWFNDVITKIRESSEKLHKMEKAQIYYTNTAVDKLCYNRSFPGEPYDESIPVLTLKGVKTSVLLYSSPCHPVCNIDLNYSSDYHSYVVKGISRFNLKAIPLTGACGNVDPVKKGYEFAELMGSIIAEKILNALHNANAVNASNLSINLEHLSVPLRTVPLEPAVERFRHVYEKYASLFYECRAKGVPDTRYFTMFEELLYADQELEVAKRAEREILTQVQVLRLGKELAIVAIPGELMSDTALSIKHHARLHGYRDLIFSAYTNDYIGYIPPTNYFEFRKYEARLALWSRVTTHVEPTLVKTVLELLSKTE